MSQKLDLTKSEIGDTFIQPFQFVNPDGTPIPQAGHTYDFAVALDPRKLNEQGDLYKKFTVPDDAMAADGFVVVTFHFEETKVLMPSNYEYKLRRIFPEAADENKRIITIFDGKLPFEY